MLIGAMNNPQKNLAEEIFEIGEMNFDYIEITLEYPQSTPHKVREERKKIVDAISSYNLGVLSHLPWYLSIAHPYPTVQKSILKEFSSSIKTASELGAQLVVIHPEVSMPYSIQSKENIIKKSIESLKEINRVCREHSLKLALETLNPKFATVEEYGQIFSEVDIGLCVDIGHVMNNYWHGYKPFFKEFREKIWNMHIHDTKGNVDHLPIGSGKIDWERAIKDIKRVYDGTMTIEDHSPDRHYLKYSRDRLEILWYGRKKFEDNQDYLYPEGMKK
jgi:sugar phosphate isomerase/epimerase